MNQLKADIAKLKKVAREVEAYMKAELAKVDDCVEAINAQQPPARETRD